MMGGIINHGDYIINCGVYGISGWNRSWPWVHRAHGEFSQVESFINAKFYELKVKND